MEFSLRFREDGEVASMYPLELITTFTHWLIQKKKSTLYLLSTAQHTLLKRLGGPRFGTTTDSSRRPLSVCCCGQFDQCWTTFGREEEEPMIFSLRVRPGDLSLDSIPTKRTATDLQSSCFDWMVEDLMLWKWRKGTCCFFCSFVKRPPLFQRTQARNKSELVISLPDRDASLNVN